MAPQWKPIGTGGLRLTLTGDNNHTLEGTLHLQDSSLLKHLVDGVEPQGNLEVTTAPPQHDYDPKGASAYAIVVIFVYGFSIVLLIASHIFLKKKEDKKDGENEKEINKYLEQAPKLQRKSEKESFRKLKKSIIPLVSVGMLASGVAAIPEHRTLDGTAPRYKDRRDGQRTRRDSHGSQKSNDDDDQVAPLLSESPVFAQKPFVYEGNMEQSPKLAPAPMPTIFEGGENESIRSQDDEERDKDNSAPPKALRQQPNDITPRLKSEYLPQIYNTKINLHKPPMVRILAPKRETPEALRPLPKHNLPVSGQLKKYNVIQCPREALKCDDEKLLHVTVL